MTVGRNGTPATGRRGAYEFPDYTVGERAVDAVLHGLGVVAAAVAAGWLLVARSHALPGAEYLSLTVYAAALAALLLASAAYNLARPGRRKEILRRIDHAAIFMMIAGTFTPFAVHFIERGGGGGSALGIVWAAALAGVLLKLAFPRRFERTGLALYLGLGWAMMILAWPVWSALPAAPVWLLVGGGVLYTAGTVVHLAERVAYHNALWHGFVLAAAGCHFTAVALASAP